MSLPIVVRRYTQGDETEIVELLESVFKGWPRFDLKCSSLDHWRWKFVDNPLKGKAIVVSERDGRIIGCSQGFYLKGKIGPETVTILQGTDLALSEKFRGLGLFPKMSALRHEINKENNVHYSYGLSNNPVVLRTRKKRVEPQFNLLLKHMIKIRDVETYFKTYISKNNLIKKYGFKTLITLNSVRNALVPSSYSRSNLKFDISEPTKSNENIGDFWNQIKENYNFIVERDSNYIKWRYNDERGGKYTLRYAYENDKILGYSVLRLNRFNEINPEGYIVDLLTIPDRIEVAQALIDDGEKIFTDWGVNIIHALVIPGHPYERLLNRNYYLPDGKPLAFNIRAINLEDDLSPLFYAPHNKLHFSYGDTDWI